jgi:predicted permease
VTETTLLWLVGAAVGLLPVWMLLKANVSSRLTTFGIPAPDVQLDWPIVAFAAGLALLVGLAFSLVPAWAGTTVQPATVLRTMGATATRRLRAAPVLTVVQLAACLALLVGALMLGSTLRHLMSVDLGFDPANVTVFHAPVSPGTTETAAYSYLTELTRRLAEHPGIDLVAMADGAPFAGGVNFVGQVRRDPADESLETRMLAVLSPDFFSALGIRLVRGRAFSADEILADRGQTRAVILGESLARRLFGSVDVIGRTVEPGPGVIVGVAADVRVSSLTGDPPAMLYRAGAQFGFRNGAMVIVRTAPGKQIQPEVRAIAVSLGSAPPVDIRTLDEAVTRARGEWDVLAWLMSALALVASLLAAVGVYGVVAVAAASRRAEFGIRMALGASVPMVRRQVLRGAAIIAAGGLVLGLAGAFGLMQVLRSRLVGVSPLDPMIWGSAAMLLVALVVVASLIPARQATRVSLADTLKAL